MTTHLIYAPLDMRAFSRWAGRRGLIRRGVYDEGYALHILLTGFFGKAALQPFRLFASERRRSAALYAYADADERTLQCSADVAGTPECSAALDPRKLLSKRMPIDFLPGQRLGFDVRVRPVRRLREEIQDRKSGEVLAKGAEVDAFRVNALHRFPNGWADGDANARKAGETRDKIYTEWLTERLGDAAEIEEKQCRLVALRRSRALRGDGVGPEGPDATFHGVLTVREPDRFAARIRNGIGRHKAYGYGMLLLRPPGAMVAEQ